MTHPLKTAWVFPGQGSQTVGMGWDLLTTATAKVRFEQAADLLGWSVLEVCQQEELLFQTRYAQPCLFVVSAIVAELRQQRGETPDLVAGHSLGEFAALHVAGVFDFETGVQLVKQRAELMSKVSTGKMFALIGCDRAHLECQLQTVSDVVLANDNHPGQLVISGAEAAIEEVLAAVKTRKVVPLKVSGAFHSPFVAEAATVFNQILATVEFQPAKIPVLSNVDPSPAIAVNELKSRLMRQMTGSVRWRETALRLHQEGIERVVEVGPGQVLTNLIQYTCPDQLMLETTC
ncbi:ACP S-malonyltransferase [Leptolyngbya sp. AN03gr2]|uniref:ACP S-malonyltransferase n=1 Tax=unclassified Leptolyngbya TaxID=2650499 RepID=UPI003D31FEA6